MEIIRHAPNGKSLVWIRYLFNLNKLTGTQTGGNIKIIEHLKKKKKKTLNSVSLTIGKDSDAGRDWRQEEKGMTEDEMAGWHHGLDGHESEWTLGFGDGQGGLVCCNSWDHKESDMTERLKWTEMNWTELMPLTPWHTVTEALADSSSRSRKLVYFPRVHLWSPSFTKSLPFIVIPTFSLCHEGGHPLGNGQSYQNLPLVHPEPWPVKCTMMIPVCGQANPVFTQ